MSAAAAAALKAKGNAEFSKGELAAAVSSWTEALSLLDRQPNPQGLHLLYGNRCVALLLVQRRGSCDCFAALFAWCMLPCMRCRAAQHRRPSFPKTAPPCSALLHSSCTVISLQQLSQTMCPYSPWILIPDILLPALSSHSAAAALKLGDFTAALRDAEAALAVEPAWAKALYRKAAALQGLGRRRDAAAAALAAAAAEPSNREVQALLRQLGSDAAAAAPAMSETTAGDGAADDSAAQQHHQQQRRRRQETPSGPGKPPPTAAMLPALLKSGPWEYMPAGAWAVLGGRQAGRRSGAAPCPHAQGAPVAAPPQAPTAACSLSLPACPSCLQPMGPTKTCCCFSTGWETDPPPLPPWPDAWRCRRRRRWRWAGRRRCRSARAGAAGTRLSQTTLS